MIVVDSSAVIHALVDAAPNPRLLALLAVEDLSAPHLLDYEVVSVLRGHILGRKLSVERGEQALADYSALRLERFEGRSMLHQLWTLRDNFTAYDASYVCLAMALRVPLVTSDKKMLEAERLGVAVQLFGSQ